MDGSWPKESIIVKLKIYVYDFHCLYYPISPTQLLSMCVPASTADQSCISRLPLYVQPRVHEDDQKYDLQRCKIQTHLQIAPPKATTMTKKAAAQPITEDKTLLVEP